MTAQQQLASMLEYLTDTGYAPATAGDFIRDHGPALVELIEAATDINENGIAGDWRRFGAALRKLTQDE